MKKIALLFLFMILAAINVDAAGFIVNLKSCERYGSEVLITFALENNTGSDRYFKCEKNEILVLDADGNKYSTSGFSYGALQPVRPSNDDKLVFGKPTGSAPQGNKDLNYSNALVPNGIDMLVRVVVYDFPMSLKAINCVQLRCLVGADASEMGGASLCWNEADYTELTIKDVK